MHDEVGDSPTEPGEVLAELRDEFELVRMQMRVVTEGVRRLAKHSIDPEVREIVRLLDDLDTVRVLEPPTD